MPDIMTKEEYARYTQTINKFIVNEGLSFLSTGCTPYGEPEGEQEDNQDGEPWFSWHPCEMCGCHLGGNREYLFGRDVNNEVQQFTICEDCAYYVNYGRLDDTTMARVEA
jgi:hypothetical protein